MSKRIRRIIVGVVVGFAITFAGCGIFERANAKLTGYSRQCIDGVEYLQFSSGASVAYTPDGHVKTCK